MKINWFYLKANII